MTANERTTVAAAPALVVAVAATGTAVASAASLSSHKTATNAQLRQALATNVASFQKALAAEGMELGSVQSTANAAANVDLGYCITYGDVTYVDGYNLNDDNDTLDQQQRYYPRHITTPLVNAQGVVSCPAGTFVSVVPTKAGL